MSTIGFSFLAALAIVGAAFVFHFRIRSHRLARLSGLELKPNCLLTRYPIAFVANPKSLFKFFDRLSDDVPAYLREHGYEVLVLEIPGRATDPARALIAALDSMSTRCHLIADSMHGSTFEMIANHKHPMVASLTLVSEPAQTRQPRLGRENHRPRLEDFKPLACAVETFEIAAASTTHDGTKQFWFESRFLDLAISLAERDAMLSD